jgi:hypothetical protein
MQEVLKKSPQRQRAAEAIHASVEPVRAYVAHISDLKGEPFYVVTIPQGTAAYQMGYRYVSVSGDELDDYLANGCSLA